MTRVLKSRHSWSKLLRHDGHSRPTHRERRPRRRRALVGRLAGGRMRALFGATYALAILITAAAIWLVAVAPGAEQRRVGASGGGAGRAVCAARQSGADRGRWRRSSGCGSCGWPGIADEDAGARLHLRFVTLFSAGGRGAGHPDRPGVRRSGQPGRRPVVQRQCPVRRRERRRHRAGLCRPTSADRCRATWRRSSSNWAGSAACSTTASSSRAPWRRSPTSSAIRPSTS